MSNTSWQSALATFDELLNKLAGPDAGPILEQVAAKQHPAIVGWCCAAVNEKVPAGGLANGDYLMWTWTATQCSHPPGIAVESTRNTWERGVKWTKEGTGNAKGNLKWERYKTGAANGQKARVYHRAGVSWCGLAVRGGDDGGDDLVFDFDAMEMDVLGMNSDDDFEQMAALAANSVGNLPPGPQRPPENDAVVLHTDIFTSKGIFADFVVTRSDETMKQDITRVQDSFDTLAAKYKSLIGLEYTLGGQPLAGLSAQQIQQVFPRLVKGDAATGLFVNYDGLQAYQVEMTKHLLDKAHALEQGQNALQLVVASLLEGARFAASHQTNLLPLAAALATALNEQPSKVKELADIIRKVGQDQAEEWAKEGSGRAFFMAYNSWKNAKTRGLGRDPPQVMRPYQRELMDAVLAEPRVPALIVMPTGAGKTLVAANVLLAMLPPGSATGPSTGVGLFIVRDRVLVYQQQRALRSAAPVNQTWRVAALFGGEGFVDDDSLGKVAPTLLPWVTGKAHVIVITSGFLEDCADSLDWTLVRAVVLDEVHNSRGQHPYAKILRRIEALKQPPLVLGLTASPGSRDSLQATTNAIRVLMARLGKAPRIFPLHDDDPRLLGLFAQPDFEMVRVAPPQGPLVRLVEVLQDLAVLLRDGVEEALAASRELQFKDTPKQAPRHGGEEDSVGSSLIKWAARVQRDAEASDTIDRCQEVFDGAWLLEHVAMSVLVLPDVGFVEGRFLLANIVGQAIGNNVDHARLAEVLEEFEWNDQVVEEDTPKLRSLIAELEKTRASQPGFKAIVRVEMRHTARWLERALARKGGALRPRLLLGRGSNRVGFSNSEMSASVAAFKGDEANVLVATSVIQEGVDVAACNLVVCFNASVAGSGTDFVQLAGRARARDSRFVALVVGLRDEFRLEKAMQQARNMRGGVRELGGG